jgi:MscS family membrane protein
MLLLAKTSSNTGGRMETFRHEIRKLLTLLSTIFTEEAQKFGIKIFLCILILVVRSIIKTIIMMLIKNVAVNLKSTNNLGLGGYKGEFEEIFKNVVNIALWIGTIILIVGTLGYNISALLAGLGIGGAAIALASRETLENFFGSISVFIDKPFHLGERIKILNQADTIFDGWVVDLGIRVSKIKTLDNRIITIPNSFFTKYAIQNVSSEPHTKIVQTINIRAENGYDRAKQVIDILLKVEPPVGSGKLGEPSRAALTTVNHGVLKITFIFFIAKDEDYFGTINAVNLEVLRNFEAAGITIVN